MGPRRATSTGQKRSESVAGPPRRGSPGSAGTGGGSGLWAGLPSSADKLGWERRRCGDKGAARIRSSTVERLRGVEMPRLCARATMERKEKERNHIEQVATRSVP